MIFKKEIDKQKELFKNELEKSKKILLVNHRRMDWDCFWSLCAFYYILKEIWSFEVKAINEDTTPEAFSFLTKEEIFETDLDLYEYNPDLIISFDVADIKQLWKVYDNFDYLFEEKTFVSIDHHISNPFFWDINIIDTSASSTCEIVYDIIKDFWYKKYLNSFISTFLLTWIITDTNSFFNTNSTAKSLEVAWELMKYNPKHQDIIINLFKKKSFWKLKLWGKILESLKDVKNSKIVWNTVPLSYFLQTNTTHNDISWVIDEFLTTIDTAEVVFVLYELEKNKIKWSFRAKSDRIDLSNFCSQFWWWWHKRASWFLIEWKNLYEVEQEVIEKLKILF